MPLALEVNAFFEASRLTPCARIRFGAKGHGTILAWLAAVWTYARGRQLAKHRPMPVSAGVRYEGV